MKHRRSYQTLQGSIIAYTLCLFFLCISFSNALGNEVQQCCIRSSLVAPSSRNSPGDIPTWYQGDEWIYTINPLSFSSPNASFSGSVQNFKQKVGGVIDGWYKIDTTGQISGQITVNGVSGPLIGQITGTSYFRISDLAERETQLHSQGTITIILPIPYEMNFMTKKAVLQVPLKIDY